MEWVVIGAVLVTAAVVLVGACMLVSAARADTELEGAEKSVVIHYEPEDEDDLRAVLAEALG